MMMKWKRRILSIPGLGFCLGVGLLAGGAQAATTLSEVFYDAVGSDDGLLFVEIAGMPGASLDGYLLEGINGSNGAAGPTIMLTGEIGADGLFVVADQTSGGTTSVVGADLLANFDFQNGPDSVVLRLGESVIDALGYGVFGASEIFAGEGNAAPDVGPGSSLARVFANLDSDDNFADFHELMSPTPGLASFAPIPEPGAGLMIGLGLSGLALAGGRHSGASRSTLQAPMKPIRRKHAWQRRSTGSTSERVERLAPERPSFWTQRKS
jgi:hypothetical protein